MSFSELHSIGAHFIVRKLNSRERRRLNLFNLVPVDAVDPKCTIKELTATNALQIYRYGTTNVRQMNLEIYSKIDGNVRSSKKNGRKKKNLIFHLQGFYNHHYHHRQLINFHLHNLFSFHM
jgi:hypothetical protein